MKQRDGGGRAFLLRLARLVPVLAGGLVVDGDGAVEQPAGLAVDPVEALGRLEQLVRAHLCHRAALILDGFAQVVDGHVRRLVLHAGVGVSELLRHRLAVGLAGALGLRSGVRAAGGPVAPAVAEAVVVVAGADVVAAGAEDRAHKNRAQKTGHGTSLWWVVFNSI